MAITQGRQLTAKDIPRFRTDLLERQRYRCAICNGIITPGKAVLDHCHATGRLRAALCSACNVAEGKVYYGMRYMAAKTHPVWEEPITWLRNLADYLEHHKKHKSPYIHHTFDVRKGKQKPKKRRKK